MAIGKTSESIYKAYRLTLKSLRNAGPQRAGARKQRSREIIAERYKMSLGEVKGIVREFDELTGVTHEHDVNYLRELKFGEAAEVLRVAHGDDPTCPICGNVPTDNGDTLRVRVSPQRPSRETSWIPVLSCLMCFIELKA